MASPQQRVSFGDGGDALYGIQVKPLAFNGFRREVLGDKNGCSALRFNYWARSTGEYQRYDDRAQAHYPPMAPSTIVTSMWGQGARRVTKILHCRSIAVTGAVWPKTE